MLLGIRKLLTSDQWVKLNQAFTLSLTQKNEDTPPLTGLMCALSAVAQPPKFEVASVRPCEPVPDAPGDARPLCARSPRKG